MQQSGVPDYIVCYRGFFVGIELKRPEDSYGVSGSQTVILSQIKKAGGYGLVADSEDKIKEIFEQIDKRLDG